VSQPLSLSTEEKQSGVAQAAGIIALGNIASRVLGLVREAVIADLFGASGLVSVFRVASIVPTMLYDLLIGGMLSAALVPVFSQVVEQEGRPALWAVFSRVASLSVVLLGGLVLLLEALAPQIAWLLGGGFEAELQVALVRMMRVVAPALLLFGLSGVVTALLYTLKRFTFPAFGATVFNLGIISAALLLVGRIDAYSLAAGVVLGSALQFLILTPDLRGTRFRFSLQLSHPALRRILGLYLPIALGLVISNVQIAIDRRLASSTGESSIAWMANATTLVQLPHGLVAVAVSLAVLPTLSRQYAQGDQEGFRHTLGQGLRTVLVLIIPATLALFVMAEPIIVLLFEHGRFTVHDSLWTVQALRYYLLGLIFAAVDWPLNYAFYARHNTLTPALVGVLSVGVYLVVALLLLEPMGMLGLVLADSAKHLSHALTMLLLTRRQTGTLADLRLGQTTGKAFLAGGVMAGVMVLTLANIDWLYAWWHPSELVEELLAVGVTAGLGLLAYLGLAALLRMEELRLFQASVRMWLRRSNLD
jgi:putative peptidoglycan lipid II flippase